MPEIPPIHNAQRIPSLDGLRGFAILGVIFWHYFRFWPFAGNISRILPGWTGVDLFFVLSGFLITGKLVETSGRPGYFSTFYRNRALRILPLYYTVLIVFFLLIHFFLAPKNLPSVDIYVNHWKSFFLFTQNWTFIFFGTPTDSSLGPLWSLAVEEQFYLLWPLVIFLIPANGRFRLKFFTILVLVVLVTRTILYLHDPDSARPHYYNTFLRLDSFLIGAILYQLHQEGIKIHRGMINSCLTLLLAVFFVNSFFLKNIAFYNPFFSTVGYTVSAILYAWLLHRTLHPAGGLLNRFFSLNFLRYTGKISYGLYIVHMPVLVFAEHRIFQGFTANWQGHDVLARWFSICACILLSFLLSTLSYYYYESYFLRLKK